MPLSPAIENEVHRIDTLISQHFELIPDLKSQRNALMPISQLPTEILCKIFMEVRGDRDFSLYTNHWFRISYGEPSLEWISISHVCRHWRDVAIKEPRLWTDPLLSNSIWATIMLERSCMAALPAITVNIAHFDKGVVSALRPHLIRASSLTIPRSSPEALRNVLTRLPVSAPILETLSVNCWATIIHTRPKDPKFSYYPTFYRVEDAVFFPNTVLLEAPKLKRLQLGGVVVNWASSLYTHLTTLAISDIPDHSKPTPTQLITMLGSAPGLTRLHLADVCPSVESNSSENLPTRLSMHSLQYVNIQGTIPQLYLFFAIFTAPGLQGCSIVVTYNRNAVPNAVPQLPRLFSAMGQSFNAPNIIGSDTDVRRLQLGHCDYSRQLDLYVRASKLLPSEKNLVPDKMMMGPDHDAWFWAFVDHRCLQMKIGASSRSGDGDDEEQEDDEAMYEIVDDLAVTIISHLFRSFNWYGLSELDISFLDYGQTRMFTSTFGTISEIRTLILDWWLIEAINNHPDDAPAHRSTTKTLSFPGLQHIIIRRTSRHWGDAESDTRSKKALPECLEQRHKYGTPIASVTLPHSYISSSEELLLLEQYVERVFLIS